MGARSLRVLLSIALAIPLTLIGPVEQAPQVAAAECTPRLGPSIPPPASVPSGIPGVHAYWYGQSGYPTLCPGQTSVATVAYYNSGSEGWYSACCFGDPTYARISLGTSGPQPGQDQASILGGNGTRGTPETAWNDFNRPSVQPASWIGPNQVAWFQFTVKAPETPGTYRLYLRPLIETRAWLEDFGVYWQVTVIPTTTTPTRVTVNTVEPDADVFIATDGTRYLYDKNDSFEYGDRTITMEEFERTLPLVKLVDTRYEPSPAERSHFSIVASRPTVTPRIGNFDSGTTNNDIEVVIAPQGAFWVVQRARVTAGAATCSAISGPYEYLDQNAPERTVDYNVPSGTYCYRATVEAGAFGYSAPVVMPDPPTPAPATAPRSLDARTTDTGLTGTFDFLDKLKVAFDSSMTTCADDAVLRLSDADGTVAELSVATHNTTCALNASTEVVGSTPYPPGTVLTFTLAGDPTIVTPGTTPGLQVPATLTSATGIRSTRGLAWDVAGSSDVVFGNPD